MDGASVTTVCNLFDRQVACPPCSSGFGILIVVQPSKLDGLSVSGSLVTMAKRMLLGTGTALRGRLVENYVSSTGHPVEVKCDSFFRLSRQIST